MALSFPAPLAGREIIRRRLPGRLCRLISSSLPGCRRDLRLDDFLYESSEQSSRRIEKTLVRHYRQIYNLRMTIYADEPGDLKPLQRTANHKQTWNKYRFTAKNEDRRLNTGDKLASFLNAVCKVVFLQFLQFAY
jgi:hypothetical protein